MKYVLGLGGAPGEGLLHLKNGDNKARTHLTRCGAKPPKGWTETDTPGKIPVCAKCEPPPKKTTATKTPAKG